MEWVYLLIAGLLEVGWAIGLGYTDGFTRLWPTVLTLIGMVASVFFLALAIVLFGESASGPRLIFMAIIVLGIVGLKMTSGH